jgi:hypothetical protein
MILSVLHDQRKSAEDHLVAQAVKKFMRDDGIEDIISPESVKDFVDRLNGILRDVQEVWRAAQYSSQIFVSDFGYIQVAGFEWSPFKFHIGKSTRVPSHDVDDDTIVLLPRIYMVLPGGEPEPITAGAVVCRGLSV